MLDAVLRISHDRGSLPERTAAEAEVTRCPGWSPAGPRAALRRCRETSHRWLLPPLGATPPVLPYLRSPVACRGRRRSRPDVPRRGGGRGRWWPATAPLPPTPAPARRTAAFPPATACRSGVSAGGSYFHYRRGIRNGLGTVTADHVGSRVEAAQYEWTSWVEDSKPKGGTCVSTRVSPWTTA